MADRVVMDTPAPVQGHQGADRMVSDAPGGDRGRPDRPYDFRGMSRDGEQRAVAAIPRGAFYVGDDGGYRENVNGPGGNKIIPIPPNSHLAQDGNFYGPDQTKPGQFPRRDFDARDGWYYKSAAGDYRTPDGRKSGYNEQRPDMGTTEDVGRSGVSGVTRSPFQFAGMFGDAGQSANDLYMPGADMTVGDASALADIFSGKPGGPTNVAIARAPLPTTDAIRATANPVLGPDHRPQTQAGRFAKAVGGMAPNALIPGSALARTLNVVGPGLGSEGARALTEAAGGDADAQSLAGLVGVLGGGAAAGVRYSPGQKVAVPGALPLEAAAIRQANARVFGGLNPEEMAVRAQQLRGHGVNPTVVDVVGENGRGVVRAAASRMGPGRQIAQDFATGRVLDLPNRMSKAARRIVSDDPRTPMEIAQDLSANRKAMADQQYAAVRDEPLGLTEDMVSALRTDKGKEAIAEAIARERNPDNRAALARLHNDALDNPGQTQITVGMADSLAKVFDGKAGAAARAGDNPLASYYGDLKDALRQPAIKAVPAYGDAVGNYATESKAIEAAGRGEDFLKRNTDEFVADLKKMSPDQLELTRATARRAIERASGENVSAAPGVARALATAPEQIARNQALLGPEGAARLQGAMGAEAQAVDNAAQIAPRTGSQTQLRAQDAAQTFANVVKTAGNVSAGNLGGLIGQAGDWLRSRGISDAHAAALVGTSVDPARLDTVIELLRARQAAKPSLTYAGRGRGLIGFSGPPTPQQPR